MHRRDVLSLLGCLMAAPAGLVGCRPNRAMTIGLHPWPGYEPLYLAQAFGWVPSSVRLVEGHNAGDSLRGLEDGSLDGAALTLDELIKARAAGLPLQAVLVFNDSVGADQVMAREPIATLGDLEGARIAVEQTAVGSLVLAKLLEAATLSPAEVTLVDIPPDRQVAAWQQGEIDVAVTYEPTASRLARLGARLLYDSSELPELILDVLAVWEDRLSWRDGPLTALVASHFLGLSHLRMFREDAFRRISAWRGLSFEEVRASYAGMELPNVATNHRYLAPEGGVTKAAEKLVDIMRAWSLLEGPVSLEGLVRSDFLPTRAVMP